LIRARFRLDIAALEDLAVDRDLGGAAARIAREDKPVVPRRRRLQLKFVSRDFVESIPLGAFEVSAKRSVLFEDDQDVVIGPVFANQSEPPRRRRRRFRCRRQRLSRNRSSK
jgi:hypothetical protein